MQAAGLQVHELAPEEKAKWIANLPDIVAPWLEQTGEDGKTVLAAYFQALRDNGVTPGRDWDANR